MSWILLALFTALFSSLRDIHIKIFSKKLDPIYLTTAQTLYAIPLLGIALFFEGIPELNADFFLYLFIAAFFSASYLLLYTKAISLSDVSLVIPFMSLSPIFLIVISPILLSEFNTGLPLLGVLFISLGTYILGIQKNSVGLLAPFKNLFKNPSCMLMLLASLSAAFAISFEKITVVNSSPIFFAFSYLIVDSAIFILILKLQKKTLKPLFSESTYLWPLGIYIALVLICQASAYVDGPATYVIAIKRLSIMFTVICACLVLKEGNLKSKLISVALMLLGTLMISLGY